MYVYIQNKLIENEKEDTFSRFQLLALDLTLYFIRLDIDGCVQLASVCMVWRCGFSYYFLFVLRCPYHYSYDSTVSLRKKRHPSHA